MARTNRNPFGQSFNQRDYDQSSPLEIIIETPAPQELYCLKCRRKVFTNVASYKILKNGCRVVVSVHHECGTLMHKFAKKEGDC